MHIVPTILLNKTHFKLCLLCIQSCQVSKKTLGQMTEVPALPASLVAPPSTSDPAPYPKRLPPRNWASTSLLPANPPSSFSSLCSSTVWLCISLVSWFAPGYLSLVPPLGLDQMSLAVFSLLVTVNILLHNVLELCVLISWFPFSQL